jgi:hypothetical protein
MLFSLKKITRKAIRGKSLMLNYYCVSLSFTLTTAGGEAGQQTLCFQEIEISFGLASVIRSNSFLSINQNDYLFEIKQYKNHFLTYLKITLLYYLFSFISFSVY